MKHLLISISFVFLVLLVSSYKVNSSSNIKKHEVSLFWSDEFDKSGAPDPFKWGFDIGTGSDGWGNQELEYYTNRLQNAYVENGVLKVKAIKEDFKGSAYTSARLLSKGKFEFMYGKVEVRAKVPAAVGTWPAVWMMGGDIDKVGWPFCGEVDILEHRGSELNKVVGAMHYPGRAGGNCNTNSTLVNTASTEFHVYKAEWSNTSVQFFVDDKLFHSVPLTPEMPYHKNFFLLVNLAIGGGFGGPVDSTFTSAEFEIDYIRVYK
jgi:beta-glucanase (GH16 family)